MKHLKDSYEQHKSILYTAIIAAFVWGMWAHGYCFFDNSFSHDSLRELHGAIFGNEWKVVLGRVFVPFYRDLFRSDVTLPWLIGMLSLLWIGLAAYLTARVFEIRSKAFVVLIAGVFAANNTVSAIAATYLHDLDCYMFALLCAAAAVYCWKYFRFGFVVGSGFVAISLGLYQSFISVTIVLAMAVCILNLLDGQKFKDVFLSGFKAIVMLLAGGALYYISMKVIQSMMGIRMLTDDYNTLDKMLQLTPVRMVELAVESYGDWFTRLMSAHSSYPSVVVKGITGVFFLICAGAVCGGLRNKNVGIPEKLLCIVLVALLPFGMNLIYVLVLGEIHDLMVYAVWITYLIALLLGDWMIKRFFLGKKLLEKWSVGEWGRCVSAVMVVFLLYGNVQFANGMYLKKDIEYDAYLSLMTRVVSRMEQHEAYVPGETEVFFAGLPDNLNPVLPGFREYQGVTGMGSSDVIWENSRSRMQGYFDFILGTPIKLADEAMWDVLEEDSRVWEMPCYPAMGSIAMIDGVFVVRLGE